MKARTNLLFVAVLGLFALCGSAWATDGPIAHWEFDEGEGTTAYDWAGNNDGIVYGASWTTGQIDGALSFNGDDDYVDCGSDLTLDVTELTWTLWIKRAEATYSNERALVSNTGGENTRGTYALQIDVDGANQDKIQFVRHGDAGYALSDTAIQDTNWHHIAVTRESNGNVVIYIDGVEDATGYVAERTAFSRTVVGTGSTSYSNFNGLIDDVRIYDEALSGDQIWQLYQDGLSNRAFAPNPADGAKGVDPSTILSWSPGKDALSHDVYFGTNYNDVNDATPDSNEYMGNQDSNSWDPNNYDPDGLELHTTYYWRIDEVGASDTYKGNIWCFSTWV